MKNSLERVNSRFHLEKKKIISIDTENSLDKTRCPFIIKTHTHTKTKTRGIFQNVIKNTYKNSTVNIAFSHKMLTILPTIPAYIQHRISIQGNQARNKMKDIKIVNGVVKLPLIAGDMILYIKKSQEIHTIKYKVGIQKAILFLHINDKLSKIK